MKKQKSFSPISDFGELYLLDHIRKHFASELPDVLVGIGDDAAVIQAGRGDLLATTDMMVEGVHFDLRFITPYQLGFKLISVNVSDIYAMGGTPRHVLLTIALPGSTSSEFFQMLLSGVKDALSFYHTDLVGGDLSSSQSGISLAATVIGSARKFILRTGARVGDRIYVTGTLGDSACGLHLLRKMKTTIPLYFQDTYVEQGIEKKVSAVRPASGMSSKSIEPVVRKHLLPEARNPKGIIRYATSMIDISDGLLIDLTRLCNESGTGARIYLEKLPLSAEMENAARHLRLSPLTLALTGGEDYELLFTVPEKRNIAATYIGDITASERIIVNAKGEEKAFSGEGYEHFTKR